MGDTVEEAKCGKCGKEITGRAMKARDVLYCEETCFVCTTCGSDLRELSVYCKEGQLYCEKCYKDNFVPKCAKCGHFILESCVRAMEKTWCARCFSCYSCGLQFSAETGYHEHGGRPYCEPCYTDIALPKCKACSRAIKDKAIKAMNAEWHLGCFICKECKCNFEGKSNFYSVEDQPICGPCAGVVEG